MKLLTQTTLLFLTVTIFVLFCGGILFYLSFRYIINAEVKDELVTEMHEVLLNLPGKLQDLNEISNNGLPVNYSIAQLNEVKKQGIIYIDTLMKDYLSEEYQPYRMLKYETLVNGKPLRITVTKSLIYSDKIVEYVAFITLSLSLFLFLCIVFLNKYFLSRIWGNFLMTVNIMKEYNISDQKQISLPVSDIAEFALLNNVFEKMHDRIRQDYRNLREFTEDLSHEIQNPLAIINSRVELLLQNRNLDLHQAELIRSIESSTRRLSTLNKSLILLSRIDNNQFPQKEKVDIHEVISTQIENFDSILLTRNISVRQDYRDDLIINADPSLMSIMLLNLLKNAVYHNVQDGEVSISIGSGILTISNTGNKPELDPKVLFNRFTRSSSKQESLGLGLAIVKKICDFYHFSINYSYINNYHVITIAF